MKTSLIILSLCAGLSAQAQNVAVLTHGAAGTEEYRNGCPTNWPSAVVDLGNSTNLPASCPATNGWVVWSTNKFETTKGELSALKEAFNKFWIERNGPGKTWTALEFNERIKQYAPDALDAIDDMIADPATPAPLRKQLRQLNRMLLAAQDINNKDPDTVAGFAAAVALGIVTAEQRDQILTGP